MRNKYKFLKECTQRMQVGYIAALADLTDTYLLYVKDDQLATEEEY